MSVSLLITFCKELRVRHRAFYQKAESVSPSPVTATVVYQPDCWEVSGVRRSYVGLNESSGSPKFSKIL